MPTGYRVGDRAYVVNGQGSRAFTASISAEADGVVTAYVPAKSASYRFDGETGQPVFARTATDAARLVPEGDDQAQKLYAVFQYREYSEAVQQEIAVAVRDPRYGFDQLRVIVDQWETFRDGFADQIEAGWEAYTGRPLDA